MHCEVNSADYARHTDQKTSKLPGHFVTIDRPRLRFRNQEMSAAVLYVGLHGQFLLLVPVVRLRLGKGEDSPRRPRDNRFVML